MEESDRCYQYFSTVVLGPVNIDIQVVCLNINTT